MCTRTSNRQKLSNTHSSKATFEENIARFKRRLRNRSYPDNFLENTLRN